MLSKIAHYLLNQQFEDQRLESLPFISGSEQESFPSRFSETCLYFFRKNVLSNLDEIYDAKLCRFEYISRSQRNPYPLFPYTFAHINKLKELVWARTLENRQLQK